MLGDGILESQLRCSEVSVEVVKRKNVLDKGKKAKAVPMNADRGSCDTVDGNAVARIPINSGVQNPERAKHYGWIKQIRGLETRDAAPGGTSWQRRVCTQQKMSLKLACTWA